MENQPDELTLLEQHIYQQNLRIIEMSGKLNAFCSSVPIAISKTESIVDDLRNSLPGAADKEMKRAGDAAIEALAERVAGIANTISGDVAKAERNKSTIKVTQLYIVALVLSAIVFGGAGVASGVGINSVQLSNAKELVAEANKAAGQAKADAAAEIEKIRAASGWAGTPEGRLAKRFFEVGTGATAARCKGKSWEIKPDPNDKNVTWCIPKRRDLIGGEDEFQYGWKIP